MFIMYFPQMIEAGMVYKAIPPLYSVKLNGKEKYFTDQRDITVFIQKAFSQKYSMADTKGIELSSKEVTRFLMRNVDYVYFLDRNANTYAVDPYLFELVLRHYVEHNKKFVFKTLQKDIKSKYRFMDAYQEGSSIVIKGTIAKSNLLIINDKFIRDCYDIIKIMDNNDSLLYKINGEIKSIYEIMNLYTTVTPSGINRYKGLGEMSEEQLAESTLYPGKDRTLIQYTLEDAKAELEAIREYENNTKKILSLIKNVTREELMD